MFRQSQNSNEFNEKMKVFILMLMLWSATIVTCESERCSTLECVEVIVRNPEILNVKIYGDSPIHSVDENSACY